MVTRLFFLCLLALCTNVVVAQHHPGTSFGYADSVNLGIIVSDTMKGSTHRISTANIGAMHIHIEYGSPGVKGRIIWGGLVAMDRVWVTGAHNATWITFTKAVFWNGNPIPAGRYGFFTIPGKESWTVILNNKSEMHLADDYDSTEDVIRINVKPVMLDKTVQRLSYIVKESSNGKGSIIVQWDKLEISIPFQENK